MTVTRPQERRFENLNLASPKSQMYSFSKWRRKFRSDPWMDNFLTCRQITKVKWQPQPAKIQYLKSKKFYTWYWCPRPYTGDPNSPAPKPQLCHQIYWHIYCEQSVTPAQTSFVPVHPSSYTACKPCTESSAPSRLFSLPPSLLSIPVTSQFLSMN